MTITQINHFIAVAETLSFTQAANAMYVSQPAISKSISKLEEHLGFKLFERSEHSLSLTAAGVKMYEFFSGAAAEYHTLADDLRSSLDNPSAIVRIGCPETWNPNNFYNIIETYFSQNHPQVRMSIECHKLSELISRLQTGKLDIVLTHDFFIPSLPNIAAKDLIPTRFGILYSKKHFSDISSLTDFAKTPFVLFDSDIEKRFSDVIRSICSKYGFTPKINNCGQLPSALFHTACGNGVMLFSNWDSAISNSSYGFFPLQESLPIKIIHFTDNPNRAVNTFVDEICALFDLKSIK